MDWKRIKLYSVLIPLLVRSVTLSEPQKKLTTEQRIKNEFEEKLTQAALKNKTATFGNVRKGGRQLPDEQAACELEETLLPYVKSGQYKGRDLLDLDQFSQQFTQFHSKRKYLF